MLEKELYKPTCLARFFELVGEWSPHNVAATNNPFWRVLRRAFSRLLQEQESVAFSDFL